MEAPIIFTRVCEACFTHFMLIDPIVFRKTYFYEKRTRLVKGYICPGCGHLSTLSVDSLGSTPKSNLYL